MLFATLVAATALLTACHNNAPKASLKSEVDTLSYQVGMVMSPGEQVAAYLANSGSDSAFVDVEIYGQENARAFNALTADICDILNDELSIPADRIYVKYGTTNHWGWNGGNF